MNFAVATFLRQLYLCFCCVISSTNPAQVVEGTFQLSDADKQLLSEQDHDIQVRSFLIY